MKRIFMRGFIAVMPIGVTLALVIWLATLVESYSSIPIKKLIGPENYHLGYGILLAFFTIFLIGTVINNWIVSRLHSLSDKLLSRIPLVKTLYRSVTDLMGFFKGSTAAESGRVVIITVAGMKLVGLVTRENFRDLVEGIGSDSDVAVFLPFSYQIGGYTVIVPKSMAKPTMLTVEEGLRFAMTAGANATQKEEDV